MNYGIVVRYRESSAIIIDRLGGKMQLMLRNRYDRRLLMHGALLHYDIEQDRQWACMANLELVKMPASWVCDDVLFFHHVLEMSNIFIMFNAPIAAIFDHYGWLYQSQPGSLLRKKIFLCRFFSLLGIYPLDVHSHDPLFFSLISAPGNIMLDIREEDIMHETVDQWLLGCIQLYPHPRRLKTINFLMRTDLHEA